MSRTPTDWRVVLIILRRELRDQIRDRRTLFMVFVLPLLLYPLLGLSMLQLSTAFEQRPRVVVVVGAERLPEAPPLLAPDRASFDPSLFDRPDEARRLQVRVEGADTPWLKPEAIRAAIQGRLADAVVTIPPDIRERVAATGSVDLAIEYDSSDEPSQITNLRVREVIDHWRRAIVASRLARDHKPADYTEPVVAASRDVAPPGEAGGSVWGRMFPFLLMIMALTGAFYPSIDLCAGEKERGTMETLLLSPASRTEVVLGKFLTVMVASITTALLNLVSMGLTGLQVAAQVAGMGGTRSGGRMVAVLAPPQPSSYVWMLVLLVPVAAFFSALCVALAVLARSMKEGQYYMTPLYLVSLPLILVTLAPEIQLNLFYSLVPITGASLLLKALILGDYATARTYFAPVLVPTLAYALIALRWAVDLFRREDVIFREAEVFDLRLWLRQIVRDREPTPGAGGSAFCFVLIIALAWFVSLNTARLAELSLFGSFLLGQLVFILGPPVGLAFLLSSDPRRTLRLRAPRASDLFLAGGMALALNPLVRDFAGWMEHLFPISESIRNVLGEMGRQVPNLAVGVLAFALLPAVAEEVAFRGFILSGLRRSYGPSTAVVITSVLFGLLHVLMSVFVQLFPSILLGLILGAVALRTGSLWPGVAFHFVNNALGVLTPEIARSPRLAPVVSALFRDPAGGMYRVPVVVLGALVAAGLFAALWRSPRPDPSDEESTALAPGPVA